MKIARINENALIKWVSFIANIVTILGIFVGSIYFYNISNNNELSLANKNENNLYVNANDNSMEKDLHDAKSYFEQGRYESAIELFETWENKSNEAKIYLGYIYSNGLGVEQNIQKAITYYKNSHETKDDISFKNYMYVNLYKPITYEQTITALRFGYEENNKETLEFLAYIETGKFEELEINNSKAIASKFWALTPDEQKEKLSNYTIENIEYVDKLRNNSLPKDTDFSNYQLVNMAEEFVTGYIEIYDGNSKKYNWQPVYDVREYYIKKSKHFSYSDLLFKESYSQEIN